MLSYPGSLKKAPLSAETLDLNTFSELISSLEVPSLEIMNANNRTTGLAVDSTKLKLQAPPFLGLKLLWYFN